jgi:xylose isomerase
MLKGERSLDQIAAYVEAQNLDPQPCSGKQELLENIVNRYV